MPGERFPHCWAICEGKPPVPITKGQQCKHFVYFDDTLDTVLNKHSRCWKYKTPWCSCNITQMIWFVAGHFTNILQGYFISIGAVVWRLSDWRNPEDNGYISHTNVRTCNITITKQNTTQPSCAYFKGDILFWTRSKTSNFAFIMTKEFVKLSWYLHKNSV